MSAYLNYDDDDDDRDNDVVAAAVALHWVVKACYFKIKHARTRNIHIYIHREKSERRNKSKCAHFTDASMLYLSRFFCIHYRRSRFDHASSKFDIVDFVYSPIAVFAVLAA